jgi:hypothetical protein
MERVFFVEDGNGGFTVPPQPHPKAFACDLRRFRRLLKYKIPSTVRLDEDQFLATYTGRKLKIYQEAVESLTVREITRKDSYVAPFVKAEKIDFTRKSDPAPRIISPRSPRYNVELGMFIKPLEHSIYYAIDEVYGTRTVMKGLNAVDRGEAISDAWFRFAEPVALFLDAKRFDQHVSFKALQWEHSVYLSCYNNDPKLQTLLSWQLRNKCFCRDADGYMKYETVGKRCSGDMNTSLGNVLIMCAMMHKLIVKFKGHLGNDGDDCVVILERRQVESFKQEYSDHFTRFGFDMRLDGTTEVLENIEFCQASPVFDGERYIMVRDPRKAIDKDNISVKPLQSKRQWDQHRSSVASCGLALAGNMPIYCAYYDMLRRGSTVQGKRKLETGMDYLARGMDGGRREPTQLARFSFFKAFGITPDEQIGLEVFYDSITPTYENGVPMNNIIEYAHQEIYNLK